ncbi:MAG: hypothetical protein ABIQ86_11375 [Steroidobacteraceae bacterium]
MSNRVFGRGLTLSARTLFIIPILLLMLTSWVGVLDKVSKDYVDGAMTRALVAFGTARAINGAISVAQSTTVSVGVGISPGEILDPINDLVEDYSSVMKVAIASLVIQKVLLAVVSETVFKVLLMLSGLALIASLLLKAVAPMNFLFKVFVSLVFLRFVLVAVVVLNGLVNHAFIDERTDTAVKQLSVLPEDLEQEVGVGANSKKSEGSLEGELAALGKELGIARNNLQESRRQLEAAKSRRSLADRLNPFRHDPAQDKAAAAVEKDESKVTELLVSRCNTMRQAAVATADAACGEVPLTARARTMAKSVGEAITEAVKSAAAKIDLAKLRQKVENAVEHMVTAMALFILQTLILPLLFLFVLSKATKSIWGTDLKEMVTRSKPIPEGTG